MNNHLPNGNVLEKDMAAELGVDRRLLSRFRHEELMVGEDWSQDGRGGILLTENGQKKIRAALPAPPAPPAAPAAPPELAPPPPPPPAAEEPPATVTIRIRRLCPNPLVIEGEPIEGQRVLVRLIRGPSKLYRPGMELQGCYKRPNFSEQWDYPGPKPRFLGRF